MLTSNLLVQFCDSGDAHIYFLNFIPGTIINHTGFGKAEYILENSHGICSLFSINSIGVDFGNQRIVVGDGVELILNLLYFRSAASDV